MKLPKVIDFRGFLSFLILHELNGKRLCGDELAKIIGSRKAGKLTPGTIYPALKKLRKAKLVYVRQTGRKKNYYLTKRGKKELRITYRLFGNIFCGLKNKIKDSRTA
ncbi:PadR family transcriptional regulator [Candidatus Woesearchaeota archaeon]|nr:PadR family transcriptional regulator [Candidatus Woesearchaeota archaeon]